MNRFYFHRIDDLVEADYKPGDNINEYNSDSGSASTNNINKKKDHDVNQIASNFAKPEIVTKKNLLPDRISLLPVFGIILELSLVLPYNKSLLGL